MYLKNAKNVHYKNIKLPAVTSVEKVHQRRTRIVGAQTKIHLSHVILKKKHAEITFSDVAFSTFHFRRLSVLKSSL